MTKPETEENYNSSGNLLDSLGIAAREGKTQLCLLLMAQGADVNMPDKHEISPLLAATSHRKIETVMTLLENGADIMVRCRNGESILHLAKNWPVDDYIKLIAMGANVNALSANRTSPLHEASQFGNAKALLLAKAHPDIRNDLGATPLSNAISWSNSPLIELLVSAGADPGAGSVHRSSHLIQAQSKNDPTVASLLIALGAKCKKHQGKNAMWRRLFSLPPLHAAASGGHTEVALKLVKEGADPAIRFLRKTASQFAMNNGYPETASVLQAAEARFAVDDVIFKASKESVHRCAASPGC